MPGNEAMPTEPPALPQVSLASQLYFYRFSAGGTRGKILASPTRNKNTTLLAHEINHKQLTGAKPGSEFTSSRLSCKINEEEKDAPLQPKTRLPLL